MATSMDGDECWQESSKGGLTFLEPRARKLEVRRADQPPKRGVENSRRTLTPGEQSARHRELEAVLHVDGGYQDQQHEGEEEGAIHDGEGTRRSELGHAGGDRPEHRSRNGSGDTGHGEVGRCGKKQGRPRRTESRPLELEEKMTWSKNLGSMTVGAEKMLRKASTK